MAATKRERAAKLREAGLTYAEVAQYLGVGSGTVYRWLNPESEERNRQQARAWKARNRLTCPECGGPMNGTSGRDRIPERCSSCTRKLATLRSRASIIAAIREWAEENDGIPPSAVCWNPALAEKHGRYEDARLFREANGRWPVASGVVQQFGTWNAAIRAAGFEPREPGHYRRRPRRGDDPAVRAEAVARYAAGEPSTVIGDALGIPYDSVTRWARQAGIEIRGRWPKAA